MRAKVISFVLLINFVLACTCSSLTPLTASPTVTAATAVSDRNRTPTTPPTARPTLTPTPTLYVPPECAHVVPATVAPATATVVATSIFPTNQPITAPRQSRVLEALIKQIEEVYVYETYNGKDWNAIKAKYRAKVQAGLATEKFYEEMKALINELGDDHSKFESPQDVAQAAANLAGANNYTGIGVLIKPLEKKDKVTVLVTFPGASAEQGGLKPHDSLLTADGHPLFQSGQSYVSRVRGPECSAVSLTVQSPNGSTREMLFIRHKVQAPLPIYAQLVATKDGSRIGYIFVPTFFDDTIPDQISQALQDWGPLDGLILDNRMNGGGSSTVIEPILSYFTSGLLGQFKSRLNSRPLLIKPNPIHNSQTVPLVVLIGQDSVSFGEIFPGVLKDSGRAKLVGDRTKGNVETLRGYNFEDGSRAWIAQETFIAVNQKKSWENDGVKPDVEVIADWDTFTFETDPAIAAALQIFGRK